MNTEYIQNLRYKLQKRVRRLNSAEHVVFHFLLIQFWGFLKGYPIFMGIIENLERRLPEMESEAKEIVLSSQPKAFNKEMEHVAASYFVLKLCIDSNNQQIESSVGRLYCHKSKHDECIEYFRSLFLEPFYEYLDEQIDDQRAILALLRRYKHKCEWFERDKLNTLWNEDTAKGEKKLGLHLYEYLHDQGIDFHIEPWSVSGEADLVGSQNSDDPLIADAKIFNPQKGKGKEYLAKGFNQLYLYTRDYNEPFGYMIIYKTCEEDLRLSLVNVSQSTPFIVHNNKTIFLVVIDIFPHETSASRRGALRTIEINEEDIVRFAEVL